MIAKEKFPEIWKNLSMEVRGVILGMERVGAIFDGFNQGNILFSIPEKSEIDDCKKLQKAKEAILGLTGFTLKIKRI